MNTSSLTPWKQSPVDGGMLRFNRRTGTNVLLRNAATEGLVRLAPRALQIGLLTPCNLSCGFCYRDTSARSVLTQEFLLDLLSQADQWGVQEVAFGGGEPLLFKGFVPLLQQLHAQTQLGLNFTTNGMLLNEAKIAALDGLVGEIRLSAYDNNRYRETLRRARRQPARPLWPGPGLGRSRGKRKGHRPAGRKSAPRADRSNYPPAHQCQG